MKLIQEVEFTDLENVSPKLSFSKVIRERIPKWKENVSDQAQKLGKVQLFFLIFHWSSPSANQKHEKLTEKRTKMVRTIAKRCGRSRQRINEEKSKTVLFGSNTE